MGILTKSLKAFAALSAIALCLNAQGGDEKVRVCPAPKEEPLSADFSVSVEGKDAPVYLARVISISAEERKSKKGTTEADTALSSFVSFSIDGEAKVSVSTPSPAKSAAILPSSAGIKPAIDGNRISFSISKPGQYVLEVDGDWVKSLQIFANAFESDAPSPNDPNVIYFGPGTHQVETVTVGSGKTLYIAEGAVVYGNCSPDSPKGPIFSLKGDNIAVRGRGIIDGSKCPFRTRSIMNIRGRNIKVEGVTLRDAGGWTMPAMGCDGLKIENIKLFGWRGNSDGIDICGCRDVEVSSCYLRTWDDLVVVKTGNPKDGESRNIFVRKCVLWNELAHCLSLGAEMRRNVENVVFSDCDVIRDKGRESALRVFHCDSAEIRNIVFDNIRFDECQSFLSLWIGKTVWSKDAERGRIDNVVFKNIHASGNNLAIELMGFDERHMIRNVEFDDVTANGKPVSPSDVKKNQFVENIVFARQ